MQAMGGIRLIIIVLLALGCATYPYEQKQVVTDFGQPVPALAYSLAGTYYQGDGRGRNILLTLHRDGRYNATWSGCGGTNGISEGTWAIQQQHVLLRPSLTTGLRRRYIGKYMRLRLRILEVRLYRNDIIFVPVKDRSRFDKNGPTRRSCFQRSPISAVND